MRASSQLEWENQSEVFLLFWKKWVFRHPDLVVYDKVVMTKPGFDLIFGSNTLKELGIILDFWTKEIPLDDISLPMRDINKLNTQAQIEKSWMMNNSINQETTKELQRTLEATKHLTKILDANYESQISEV